MKIDSGLNCPAPFQLADPEEFERFSHLALAAAKIHWAPMNFHQLHVGKCLYNFCADHPGKPYIIGRRAEIHGGS